MIVRVEGVIASRLAPRIASRSRVCSSLRRNGETSSSVSTASAPSPCGPTSAADLHRRIPGSSLRIYPEAGHDSIFQLPTAAARDMGDFLGS